MRQSEVIAFCDDLLNISSIQDFCPNGLQVEGDDRTVRKIALGVSITLEFIEKSVAERADLIITHHGLIWNKESRVIQGPFKRKIFSLLSNGIAAAAYHLPLDVHPEIGNNFQLATRLGLGEIRHIFPNENYAEGVMGVSPPLSIEELSARLATLLNRQPTVLPFGEDAISKIAIVTGGAQDYFLRAIESGADCFITGEISERNYAMSQEYQTHFISAGHYATETFGIQALGEYLTKKIDCSSVFIDIENPI